MSSRSAAAIPIKANARFYGVNLLCELDVEGEYYINEKNGTLYFFPPSSASSTVRTATITSSKVALNITGTAFITIDGIEVRNSQGVGILAEHVKGVTLHNVTSSNHGTNGIQIEGTRPRVRKKPTVYCVRRSL